MKIIDDIKRSLTAENYRSTLQELQDKFSHPDISLYSYGGLDVPRSDLDTVAILSEAFPEKHVKDLYNRLNLFTSSDETKRYLFKQKVKICPKRLWDSIFYVYPRIWQNSFRRLSGPEVTLTTPPETKEFHYMQLLDRSLIDVHDLTGLTREGAVSLRAILTRLHKIRKFTIPSALKLFEDNDLKNMLRQLDEAQDLMISRTEPDTKTKEKLSSLLDQSYRASKILLLRCCEEFLSKVIEVKDDRYSQDAPLGTSRFPMPALYTCHRQAYAHMAEENSFLKRRFELGYPKYRFSIRDEAYGELLKKQMAVVCDFEQYVSKCGVPCLMMRLAGLWHEPSYRIYLKNYLIYSAKKIRGAFLH